MKFVRPTKIFFSLELSSLNTISIGEYTLKANFNIKLFFSYLNLNFDRIASLISNLQSLSTKLPFMEQESLCKFITCSISVFMGEKLLYEMYISTFASLY